MGSLVGVAADMRMMKKIFAFFQKKILRNRENKCNFARFLVTQSEKCGLQWILTVRKRNHQSKSR